MLTSCTEGAKCRCAAPLLPDEYSCYTNTSIVFHAIISGIAVTITVTVTMASTFLVPGFSLDSESCIVGFMRSFPVQGRARRFLALFVF